MIAGILGALVRFGWVVFGHIALGVALWFVLAGLNIV